MLRSDIRRVLVLSALIALPGVARADQPTRLEHDLLGDKAVPAAAYYGVQTARALENFQISGVPLSRYPDLVDGLVLVKLAAARANHAVGALDKRTTHAIERACEAILKGRYHDQFAVDLYQGGAGTSSNMNANEVIANVALELAGRPKGDYATIDPHDHLNMSQSTNDAYPTALKVAFLRGNDRLVPEVRKLAAAFRAKANAYIETLKMGRTEMQDAVPMTVGQELHAFAASLDIEAQNLLDGERALYAVNMGGTAIGTGLNAPRGYAASCARELARLTRKPIVPASDLIAATASLQGFVTYSAALRGLAVTLSKIASDLILLGSGPRAGLGELSLPALQPGSSIMPGKVNPVMPEVLNVVAFRVMSNDVAVTLAAREGQLQLNAYEPLVGIAILESQDILEHAIAAFRTQCVDGITVNEGTLARHIEQTVGIVTALNPVIGYERATELATEAYRSGKGILEIVREKHILTEDQIKALLDPGKLTGLDRGAYPKTKQK